jgi:hypothetical protein
MDLLDKLRDAATTGNRLYSDALEEIERLRSDVKLLSMFIPDWAKEDAPEGLDPTMYGTGTKEGDQEVIDKVKGIWETVCSSYIGAGTLKLGE